MHELGAGTFDLRGRRLLILPMLVALSAVLSSPALADESAERHGLTVGLSLGGGVQTRSCDSCDQLGSAAAAFRIGWMLTPHLALLYDGSGLAASPDGFASTSTVVFSGAAQYWPVPRFFLEAGLGLAQLKVKEGVFAQQERNDKGLGVVAAAGYELATLGRFPLALEARSTIGFYDAKPVVGIAALVGLSWY